MSVPLTPHDENRGRTFISCATGAVIFWLCVSPAVQRQTPTNLPCAGVLSSDRLRHTESSGTDAVCQWRPPSGRSGNVSPEQLSADAEKAEDLAVRYADGHDRPGTNPGSTSEGFHRTIDQCMAVLFQAVADQDHVTPQQVRDSISKHRSTPAGTWRSCSRLDYSTDIL